MRASRTRCGRASLWALLLLVPLLHGAGAHLSRPAGDAPKIAAPDHGVDLHGTDELCALCVAGRSAGDRTPCTGVQRPAPTPARPVACVEVSPDLGQLDARPDAPRAPPLRVA